MYPVRTKSCQSRILRSLRLVVDESGAFESPLGSSMRTRAARAYARRTQTNARLRVLASDKRYKQVVSWPRNHQGSWESIASKEDSPNRARQGLRNHPTGRFRLPIAIRRMSFAGSTLLVLHRARKRRVCCTSDVGCSAIVSFMPFDPARNLVFVCYSPRSPARPRRPLRRPAPGRLRSPAAGRQELHCTCVGECRLRGAVRSWPRESANV